MFYNKQIQPRRYLSLIDEVEIMESLLLEPQLIKDIDQRLARLHGKTYRTIQKKYGFNPKDIRKHFGYTRGPNGILDEQVVRSSNAKLHQEMFDVLKRALLGSKQTDLSLIYRKEFKRLFGGTPREFIERVGDVDEFNILTPCHDIIEVEYLPGTNTFIVDGYLPVEDKLLSMYIGQVYLNTVSIGGSTTLSKNPCSISIYEDEYLPVPIEYREYASINLNVENKLDEVGDVIGVVPQIDCKFFMTYSDQIVNLVNIDPSVMGRRNVGLKFLVGCYYLEKK